MILTGRAGVLGLLGAGLVGALVAAGVGAWTALVAVNVGILIVVGVDAARAAPCQALVLTRDGDRRVRLGEVAHVRLSVTNTGSRRWRGRLRDAWVPTARATLRPGGAGQRSAGSGPVTQAGDRAPLDLGPGQTAVLDVLVAPSRRGDRPTDRVTLRSLGPLGIAGRQRSTRVDWSVRTLPPFTSRRHLPARLARLRDMDGRQTIAARAQGTEFDSLREYVAGDDVRSIDWRATARAGDVMIRTWRPERDRRVVLVLDSGRTSAARIGDETRLDILIDAGLLLSALAARAGDRVDLLAHDRRTRLQVSGGGGPSLLPTLVDAVADLEPELTETDYRGLVSAVLSRVRKRALVVLFVALERPAMEEGLLPALAPLTARHTVIVASVREPAPAPTRPPSPPSADPAHPSRSCETDRRFSPYAQGLAVQGAVGDAADVGSVYLAAARARADLDRGHVATVLQRMGVRVLEATPDRIAPALADAYLDLKAAGRL